jgi:hypothetical protein
LHQLTNESLRYEAEQRLSAPELLGKFGSFLFAGPGRASAGEELIRALPLAKRVF